MRCQNYIGKRKEKVVVVAKSSQWRVKEFLASENSQDIPNLVIIAKSDQIIRDTGESPYILYTHNLFVDGLGSSKPMVLTSWYGGNFTRPMNLFRPKMRHGVSGHRFVISVAHQPPFVIKQQTNNDEQEYEGIEIRLIELLAEMYNFTIDYREAPNAKLLGAAEAVLKTIETNTVNLGLAGLYITDDRYNSGTFEWHSEDCAAFVSLTSTALPRYRAIMGPFRWTVWLTLTLVYMFSILLFSFSDKLTLRHLITNPEELENLFWYMFGTFTNCFTFTGKNSWTKADKLTTKLLIGIYWMFTIIITACYTGSIIAFVTLPVFPTVVDTIDQLIAGRFDIGMLDKGGWQNWFHNLTDARSKKLLQQPDYVPNVESGFKNVTKAFFWPYAFLGSREQLKYIAKTNFTIEGKRNLLHISSQCFATYKVGILIPTDSVYKNLVKRGIRLAFEFGLVDKMKSDVEWKMMRSSTGKLLAIS
ncbi:ionotropic receptor 21a isoform X2 [Cylas formicarius]|uniref:ionotropic receptor 21a isoform X2 n=1 Tax=Cylas formicarius TaxID=197179 RepID=UPI0029585B13|nr:ionotropic receptor 21a isoform X2 [Cylas formicarius]